MELQECLLRIPRLVNGNKAFSIFLHTPSSLIKDLIDAGFHESSRKYWPRQIFILLFISETEISKYGINDTLKSLLELRTS